MSRDPLIPRILAGVDTTPHHKDAPPTIQELFEENRALLFRTALLHKEPIRALARYLVKHNRDLRTALDQATRRLTSGAFVLENESSGD